MNLAGNQESINKKIYSIMHQKNIYICEIALQRIAESNEVPWGKKTQTTSSILCYRFSYEVHVQ